MLMLYVIFYIIFHSVTHLLTLSHSCVSGPIVVEKHLQMSGHMRNSVSIRVHHQFHKCVKESTNLLWDLYTCALVLSCQLQLSRPFFHKASAKCR